MIVRVDVWDGIAVSRHVPSTETIASGAMSFPIAETLATWMSPSSARDCVTACAASGEGIAPFMQRMCFRLDLATSAEQ
ncbi:hypothetical protein CVO74_12830 [Xanthomonas prunicola]|uniref:Uncharacterized protein n=1 Tax=Xanthomonas prunicola TaxID=2053930 RepID=A0A2N3RJS6_9XANT|nr:hypothetical protein XpruCFBP8353_12680 [Xanthomonas prunicola]PKV17018.1 hypothetical protein XpruCFBP8354_12685 [Xanthomonas prunicola]PKV20570.1 hypothetical protein CVO74_12830 [Xanthomonas prunicola]